MTFELPSGASRPCEAREVVYPSGPSLSTLPRFWVEARPKSNAGCKEVQLQAFVEVPALFGAWVAWSYMCLQLYSTEIQRVATTFWFI